MRSPPRQYNNNVLYSVRRCTSIFINIMLPLVSRRRRQEHTLPTRPPHSILIKNARVLFHRNKNVGTHELAYTLVLNYRNTNAPTIHHVISRMVPGTSRYLSLCDHINTGVNMIAYCSAQF